jgi:uncharacterized membrane protein
LSDRSLRFAVAIVALAGIAVAGYLSWAHYADSTVVCVAGGGCETVQKSKYSEMAGVPVAALGLVAYVVVLALTAWDSSIARLSAAAIALTGLLFGAYLLALQFFVIDAICVWCLANDVLIAPALAVLTALRLRQDWGQTEGSDAV